MVSATDAVVIKQPQEQQTQFLNRIVGFAIAPGLISHLDIADVFGKAQGDGGDIDKGGLVFNDPINDFPVEHPKAANPYFFRFFQNQGKKKIHQIGSRLPVKRIAGPLGNAVNHVKAAFYLIQQQRNIFRLLFQIVVDGYYPASPGATQPGLDGRLLPGIVIPGN
jgi:hypothetical protein